MSELKVLHRGNKSANVRELQAATNRRLRARGLDKLTVKEDGILGTKTLEAVRKAAWALGAQSRTFDSITAQGKVPIGVQRMIRNPGRRSDNQKAIAKQRIKLMRTEAKKAATAKSSRDLAVNAFLAKVGTTEHPFGSNSGGIITVMEAYWGFGPVPWCGIAFGYHAKKFGGVQGMRSDVASVAAIEQHARNHDKPYGKWVQGNVQSLLRGSAVVLGGHGIHVAMKVGNAPGGYIKTVEGNTSFGSAGSQSNGGCIAARLRSPSEIYGGASMHYPS